MVRPQQVLVILVGAAWKSGSISCKVRTLCGVLQTKVRTMSRVKDRTPKTGGKSPTFQIRINPELREQLDQEAEKDQTTLANWFKELARKELKSRGIEPKG